MKQVDNHGWTQWLQSALADVGLPWVPVLLGAGMTVLAYATVGTPDAGPGLARPLLVLVGCAIVVTYGAIWNPLAPLYCWAFMAPLYLSDGIGKILILGLAISLYFGRRKVGWRWHYSVPGILFCVWSLLSLLWAKEVLFSNTGFLRQVLPYVILSMLVAGVRDPRLPKHLGFVVLCATAVGAGFTLQSWLTGEASVLNLDSTDFASSGRYASLVRPDIFSPWCLWGVVGALYFTERLPTRKTTAICAGFSAALWIAFALGISGIRSSLVALGVALLAFALLSSSRLRFLAFLGVVGAALAFVISSGWNPFEHVVRRIESISEDRGSGRFEIWEHGLKLFQQSPVIGVGWDNFGLGIEGTFGSRAVSHNIYLGKLVELGIFGAGMMLAWFASLLNKAWRSPDRALVFSLSIAYLVQGLFLDQFIVPYFWLALGVAEACRPRARPLVSRAAVAQATACPT